MSEHPEQPVLPPEDPYLWDGSGPVDPRVAGVEREVAALRLSSAPLQGQARSRGVPRTLAAAAVLMLVGAAVWWAVRPAPGPGLPTEVTGATWRVVMGTGVTIGDEQARMEGGTIRRVEVRDGAGGEVRTESGSGFRLAGGSVVEVAEGAPRPTLRLVSGEILGSLNPADSPVALVAGTWEATIHGRAEVACRMNVKQGPQVVVTAGWVEIADHGGKSVERPVRLAAGDQASLEDFAGRAPPASASPAMTKAYEGFQLARSGKLDPKSRWVMLDELLQAADGQNAAWLWNLAWEVRGEERVRIIARLDELVPAKLASSRESRAELEPGAMDELWLAIVAQAEDARRKGE